MNFIDLWLLGMIAGFVVGGFRTGFVRRLFSLGFLAVSFVVASYLHQVVAGPLASILGVREDNAGLIAFVATFGVMYVGLYLVSRPFLSRIAVTGMSRVTDQVLGTALGLVEGAVLASVAIVIILTYADDEMIGAAAALGLIPDLVQALEDSTIARFLMDTCVPFVLAILGPLLPKSIEDVGELLG
ncbi:MAG TPA: CvpA family protein [Vicinamibacterales bacterium]|nr:CvpA family protein [Vicinamibacterales bacterium]